MGRVEPGDDMHGTQRTVIQTGTRVRVAYCDEFFGRSLSAAALGKIRRDLFGIAAAIGGP